MVPPADLASGILALAALGLLMYWVAKLSVRVRRDRPAARVFGPTISKPPPAPGFGWRARRSVTGVMGSTKDWRRKGATVTRFADWFDRQGHAGRLPRPLAEWACWWLDDRYGVPADRNARPADRRMHRRDPPSGP
jgi:hypothetical protein